MLEKTQFVRDLKDKEPVRSIFLVKYSAVAVDRNGKSYLNLVLTDRTGDVEARIWDDPARYMSHAARDAFVAVEGKCQLYQGRKQVVVKDLQLVREDEVELKDYVMESPVDAEALYSRLLGFVDSMQDPFYKALAQSILRDDPEIERKFKIAPAAKSMHHAYKGGLLEHVVSITGILDALAKHYEPYLDRDLLFLGGFFHDIGKIWELSYEKTTDYTAEGRLIGHLVQGVELIERKVQQLAASNGGLAQRFPGLSQEALEEKKLLVKHLILSHHGKLEFGSPKRPKCLEAQIVHMIDDLDSKFNAITQFIKLDASPGRWTVLNKHYERYFFKPDWANAPDSRT